MLFKTIEEVKEFLNVSTSVKFTTVKPSLDTAENEFLIPVLGEGMYNELQEYYSSLPIAEPTEVQEATGKLLRLAQNAVVHIAYWYGFDLLNTFIEEGGFNRLEGGKFKGLYKYQEENLKAYFKNSGFNALDTMLAYLDGEDKAYFAEFHESETGLELKGMFIPNTDVFNKIYYIGKSRLIFMRMKPYMSLVEDTQLRQVLGEDNYVFVKEEMVKAQPDVKVVALLPYVRKPIAYLSTALLMEDSGAELGDKGLYFEGRSGVTLSDTQILPATAERINLLVKRNRAIGEGFINALQQYLLDHAIDWGNYAMPVGSFPRRDNDGKRAFFA
jgi:hypothetical protein